MKWLGTYSALLPSVALSVLGFALLLFSTRRGVGLSPDSALYIGSARNLISGHSLTVPSWSGEGTPLVYYPPLYSGLLAGIGLFGTDPLDGARGLNALLFAANIFLAGLCLHASTRSFFLPGCASLMVLASFPMVLVHSMAWSEPLFIFFAMLAIYFLSLYLERPSVWAIIASSVAVALATLTRYAGISLVAAGVAATFLVKRQERTKKWVHAVTFLSVSSAPLVLWIGRNLMETGIATGRRATFHPVRRGHLEALWNTVTAWLFPLSDPPQAGWLGVLVVVLLGLLLLLALRHKRLGSPEDFRGASGLPALLQFFLLSYGLLLVLSISFLDAQTPLDQRILSPAYLALLLLFFYGMQRFLAVFERLRILPAVLGVVVAVIVLLHALRSASWLQASYDRGLGYADRTWRQSELLGYLRTVNREAPIFTNGPDIIYLLTGRPAYMIPRRMDPGTTLPNSHYVDELAVIRRVLREEGGVVVYFRRVTWRSYLASENEMKEELNLNPIVQTEDGAVYK